MKNFPKALAALAALSFVGTSAFAQLNVNGTITTTSCALGVTTSATGTSATTATVTLPNLISANTRLGAGGTVGPFQDAALNTIFYVKPTSVTCAVPVGSAAGTFNVYFSTNTTDTVATTKAANTAAVATRATNLVIDLVPTGGTTTAPLTTGIDITQATPASQHGLANAIIQTGASLSFNARYYKTTTTATTGTTVAAVYTLNNVYP